MAVDVLLDADLHPWLLEVNNNPSLALESPSDIPLKKGLIRSVFAVVLDQPAQLFSYVAA